MDTEHTTGHTSYPFLTKTQLAEKINSALNGVEPVCIDNINRKIEEADAVKEVLEDVVNHPSHYTAYQGLEVIDLTEQMNFNKGNAVKYIARAGLKDPSKEVEDLLKAAWYIQREIQRLTPSIRMTSNA